eukprot:Hpha_TRINITY_DN12510_c1_g1::TRINITY_DN12510_c1_g1_i1::g.50859::m.50859
MSWEPARRESRTLSNILLTAAPRTEGLLAKLPPLKSCTPDILPPGRARALGLAGIATVLLLLLSSQLVGPPPPLRASSVVSRAAEHLPKMPDRFWEQMLEDSNKHEMPQSRQKKSTGEEVRGDSGPRSDGGDESKLFVVADKVMARARSALNTYLTQHGH